VPCVNIHLRLAATFLAQAQAVARTPLSHPGEPDWPP